MNAFQNLICKMKIAGQDLQTLHHNLRGGEGQWLPLHEQLGDLYDKLADMTDDLIEIGICAGVDEPGIDAAVQAYRPLPAVGRGVNESVDAARRVLNDVAEIMQIVGDGLDNEQRYIQSRLDDYIYDLRKEAGYKLAAAVKQV